MGKELQTTNILGSIEISRKALEPTSYKNVKGMGDKCIRFLHNVQVLKGKPSD